MGLTTVHVPSHAPFAPREVPSVRAALATLRKLRWQSSQQELIQSELQAKGVASSACPKVRFCGCPSPQQLLVKRSVSSLKACAGPTGQNVQLENRKSLRN